MARTNWDRDQHIRPPAAKLKYTETLLPATGFVTDGNGSQPFEHRIAAQLRELEAGFAPSPAEGARQSRK